MIEKWIKKNINKIKKNDFFKSVATLSLGTLGSQAFSMLTLPIISRLYAPNVIGDFSIITSNAAIIGTIICLSLMRAIMLPKSDLEAKAISTTIILTTCVLMTIMLFFLVITSGQFELFDITSSYKLGCLILYIYVILMNVSNVYYASVNREKLYKVLFWNPLIGTIIRSLVCISLGLIWGNLICYALGNISAFFANILHMRKYVRPFVRHNKEFSTICILKSYKDFLIYQLPSDLIGTIARQLPILMISKSFNSKILGNYSMAMTILQIPGRLISGPINRVYYKEIAELDDVQKIGNFSLKILQAGIKLAIIPICVFFFFAKPIFIIFLGKQWEMAGVYASILSISILVSFCNSCLSGKFIVIRKQKLILLLNCIGIGLYYLIFKLAVFLSLDSVTTIFIYSCAIIMFELFDLFLFIKSCKLSYKSYIKFVVQWIIIPIAICYSFKTIF